MNIIACIIGYLFLAMIALALFLGFSLYLIYVIEKLAKKFNIK